MEKKNEVICVVVHSSQSVTVFSLQERIAQRQMYFSLMDVDGNGTISFDEWLDYAISHIVKKVAKL